jgi:mono/diheme cytochrome c family protein
VDCAVTGALTDGNASAGQAIYNRRCKACHGVEGDGKGKRANALTKKPGAWNTDEAWAKTTDKFKFQSTKCGGKVVGKSDDMPDYPELTDQQIWDVLAYAKTLRSAAK